MKNVKTLRTPPTVGETYRVECVFGTLSNIGWHRIPPRWWPVFTPSHQDSIYAIRQRTVWKETDTGYIGVDEVYYEDDPSTPHHYHIDPRFTPEEFYTQDEIQRQSFHSTIRPESEIEIREMVCVREMPIQVLFTGFGKQFVADHAGKKMKGCDRCPHKGVALASMPVVDGRITCPAHGLKFDCETKECVSRWEKDDDW